MSRKIDVEKIVHIEATNRILHEDDRFIVRAVYHSDREMWPYYDDENHVLIRTWGDNQRPEQTKPVCLDENLSEAWMLDDEGEKTFSFLVYSKPDEGMTKIGNEICDYSRGRIIESKSYITFIEDNCVGLREKATGKVLVEPVYRELHDISSIWIKGSIAREEDKIALIHRDYGQIAVLPYFAMSPDKRGRLFCHRIYEDMTDIIEITIK